MGFAAGFQVGASAVERGLKMREEDKLKRELAAAYAKPEEFTDYTPEQTRQIQGLQAAGGYDVQAVPGAEGQAPTLRYSARPESMYYDDMGQPEAPIEIAPQQVQRYGGQTVAGQFDPTVLRGLQMREAARALGASGDVRGAAALEMQAEDFAARAEDRAYQAKERPLRLRSLEGQIVSQGQQQELTAAQLRGLGRAEEKEVGFNSAMSEINKTEYKTPAERDAAVLKATEQFKGPEAKAALQANYSTNERNNILIKGAEFDQKIKQARLKGPSAALQAIDDLNDSFKLEIDGFKVTQVNNDGTRVPFMAQAKTPEEFALLVDTRIKEGGAYELAKFRQDELTRTAQIGYYNALAKKAASEGGAAANQLSGVQVGYARDEKGNPIQVMTALRFNKRNGELESVQVPLGRNVVPASALDPEKITKAAELIVNTPVDPTNKNKDAPKHTFQTARQAVTDQIFNQYLGTGVPAGGLDLSPEAVAKRAREQAEKDKKPAAPAASAPVGLSLGQQPPNAAATARDARFEQNAQAGLVMREREQRAANDPDIKALRVQLANMRSGDPRKTAELTQQIIDLRQQRYGF
jgi:hypothetical protein